MADEIPQWAVDEANKRSGHSAMFCPAIQELARMIAEHEEAPVDPLLIEAREMFAEDHKNGEFSVSSLTGSCVMKYGAANDEIRAGKHDGNPIVRRYVKALKRGMELAGERS